MATRSAVVFALLVCVFWVALPAAAARHPPPPRPTTMPLAYLPVPGMCTADAHCPPAHMCTPDGSCAPNTTHGPPPSHVAATSTVVLLALLPPASLALLLCATAALSAVPASPWEYSASQSAVRSVRLAARRAADSPNVGVAACFGSAGCVAAALIIGLTLGLVLVPTPLPPSDPSAGPAACSWLGDPACGPALCNVEHGTCGTSCRYSAQCAPGARCVDGACAVDTAARAVFGVHAPRQSKLAVAAVVGCSAVAACLFCTCACFLSCPAAGSRQARAIRLFFFSLCCALAILPVAIALGVTSVKATKPVIFPLSTAGNGTACGTPAPCFPYACDYKTARCRDRCTASDQCGQGYACSVNGTCAWDAGAGYTVLTLPTVFGSYLSLVFVASSIPGALLALGAVTAANSFSLCFIYRARRWQSTPRGRRVWLGGSPLCTAIIGAVAGTVILLVVALTLRHPVPALPPLTPAQASRGAACAAPNAVSCAPYWCDMYVHKCRSTCASSAECATPGTSCIDGACVTESHSVSRPLLPKWLALVIVLATMGAIVVCCACVPGLAVTVIPRLVSARRVRQRVSILFAGVIALAVAVGLCLIFPLLLVRVTVPLAGVRPGTTPSSCVGVGDPGCWPYYCQASNKTCASLCAHDDECRGLDPAVIEHGTLPTGVHMAPVCAAGGSCVLAPARTALDVGTTAAVLTAIGVGVFAAVALGLMFGCGRASCRAPVLYGMRGLACGLVLFLAVLATLFVLAFTGLILVNATTIPPVFREPPDTRLTAGGAACGPTPWDARCGPNLCDTRVGKCMVACTRELGCGIGHTCGPGGVCVAASASARDWVLGVALGTAAVALIIFFAVPGLRRTQMLWAAIREHRLLAALTEHEEKQALITKARVDVGTALPYGTGAAAVGGRRAKEPLLLPGAGVGSIQDVEWGGDASVSSLAGVATDPECCVCFSAPSAYTLTRGHCGHGFCGSCVASSLSFMVDTGALPGACPGCVAEGDESDATLIAAHVVEDLVFQGAMASDEAARFIQLGVAAAFGQDELVFCPVCDLPHVRPDVSGKSQRARTKRGNVACMGCGMEFCASCAMPWFKHAGYSCAQLEKLQANGEDRATVAFLKATSKQCPQCSAPISRPRGHACHHVSCSCGARFCYVDLLMTPCGMPHGLYCDDSCDCVPCEFCRPGAPCAQCPGDRRCPVCHPPDGEAGPSAGPLLDDVGVVVNDALLAELEAQVARLQQMADDMALDIAHHENAIEDRVGSDDGVRTASATAYAPNAADIELFLEATRATEADAVRLLREVHGDVNAAVHMYFAETFG